MSRALVTGAGGFIGSQLTERLVREGHEVRAFIRYNSQNHWGWLENAPPAILDGIHIHQGDLRDPESVRKAVAGMEVVYHLGALISIPYSYTSPTDIVQTNVGGTLNMLNACVESKTLRRLVHTSTSAVYGTARFTPITEDHPLQAQSPYSASKIAADKLVESYHRSFGVPATIIRPFNIYGPRQSPRAMIPSIIIQALRGNVVKVGSLEPVRDFCFVEDTINGFLAGAASNRAAGEVLNLGTGVGIGIKELVEVILGMLGSTAQVVTEQARIRPEQSKVMQLICDRSRAGSALDWRPAYSLQQGLSETIRWMQQHLDRYKADFYNI